MLLKLDPEGSANGPKIKEGAPFPSEEQDTFRNQLFEEWDDVTRLILTKVEQSTN